MLLKRSNESRLKLKEYLRLGEVVVMACDTIYGFIGRVPDTEDLIRAIKGRDEKSPFLQLISDTSALEAVAVLPRETDILNLWPGPFTFVFQLIEGGNVAFRIPEDTSLRSLIRDLGFPLYSSSVNRSGRPSMNTPSDIEAEFGNETALIEDSGLIFEGQSSTVVDLTASPYRILRQGAGKVPPHYLSLRGGSSRSFL